MLKSSFTTPSRFKSPLRYPGGKQKAIDQISAMLPTSASEYREPLVGGASVYFHARSIKFAHQYWINDKFQELISFWHCVQNPTVCLRLMQDLELLRCNFQTAVEIKNYFSQSRMEQPEDTYREAFLFFFFNRVTFSGTTKAGGFSEAASTKRFTKSAIQRLADMPEALSGTKITNFDFTDVIKQPGPDVFLFLDPPYYTARKLYGPKGDLHIFDHELLASLLKTTSHRFLITYDDCPEIRKLYQWANQKDFKLQYGMNNCDEKHTSKIGNELFICNY